jgi:hypothetical protein
LLAAQELRRDAQAAVADIAINLQQQQGHMDDFKNKAEAVVTGVCGAVENLDTQVDNLRHC